MKAVIYDRYGTADNLRMAEVPAPVPADDEILIRIHAVSINGSDREGLAGTPAYARMAGLTKPRYPILGSDIAGRVEAVGSNHTEFKVGDVVFGELPGYRGGFAEYATTNGKTLALKPSSLTFEQAAAIPQGGVIALRGIRDAGKVRPGQRVLINGAGGSAGCFAVQIAKLLGAHVTAVDSAGKREFLRALGADDVVDYQSEDYTKRVGQYDLILDLIAHRSVLAAQRALKRGGTYFIVGGSTRVMLGLLPLAPLIRASMGKHMRVLMVPQNRNDLLAITELVEAGQVKPVIDRVFPFDQTRAAMRYVAEGHAQGKVVIAIM